LNFHTLFQINSVIILRVWCRGPTRIQC